MNYDLISRKAAQEALQGARIMVTGMRYGKTILSEYARQCRDSLLSTIDTVEPADAEYVKHGYWMSVGKTEKGTTILMCSCCKTERKGIAKSKYCRDCGARMDLTDIPQEAMDEILDASRIMKPFVTEDFVFEQDTLWPKENPYLKKENTE